MATEQSPTVRRRRLALELRRLREAARLTCEEVAEHLECSASKISRVETGRVSVSPRDVRDMLELYGVTGKERDSLVQLARDSRQKGWWHAYSDPLNPQIGTYVGLESAASEIRVYEVSLIPSLLQTEDYARAVIRGGFPSASRDEVERRVQVRMERQDVLRGDRPLELWGIVDEAALCRQVGGRKVMYGQLRYLIESAELPQVTLQVIPFGAGAHAGMPGSFALMQFTDAAIPDVVYVDTMAGELFLEEESDVRRYKLVFEHLRAVAESPDASRSLMADLIAQM